MLSLILRDMVKRLINKMDFDALEVKMKKCKVRSLSSPSCITAQCTLSIGTVLPPGR